MADSTEFSSSSLCKQCDESCNVMHASKQLSHFCLSRLFASRPSGMSCMMARISKSSSLPEIIRPARRCIAFNWSRCSAVTGCLSSNPITEWNADQRENHPPASWFLQWLSTALHLGICLICCATSLTCRRDYYYYKR